MPGSKREAAERFLVSRLQVLGVAADLRRDLPDSEVLRNARRTEEDAENFQEQPTTRRNLLGEDLLKQPDTPPRPTRPLALKSGSRRSLDSDLSPPSKKKKSDSSGLLPYFEIKSSRQQPTMNDADRRAAEELFAGLRDLGVAPSSPLPAPRVPPSSPFSPPPPLRSSSSFPF